MKHLKLRAYASPESKTFDLTILEQTHEYSEFAGGSRGLQRPWVYSYHSFLHGEVALVSSDKSTFFVTMDMKTSKFVDWGMPSNIKIIVYLKGRTLTDGVIKNIPVEYWNSIKEAAKEYNKYYAKD